MGSESMKTHNLRSVINAFGLISPGGAGEGGFVKCKPLDPKFDIVKGNDGTVVRYYTGARLWEITYTLLSTSKTNDDFSAIHVADDIASRNGDNGVGVAPWFLKNRAGKMLLSSPRAWITKFPDLDVQAKPTDNEWILHAADMAEFVGGVEF